MAIGIPLAGWALATAAAGTAATVYQGEQQKQQQKAGLRKQEAAQSMAETQAAAEMMTQRDEQMRLRKQAQREGILPVPNTVQNAANTLLSGPAAMASPVGGQSLLGG